MMQSEPRWTGLFVFTSVNFKNQVVWLIIFLKWPLQLINIIQHKNGYSTLGDTRSLTEY